MGEWPDTAVGPQEVVESIRARVLATARWIATIGVLPLATWIAAREVLAGAQRPVALLQGIVFAVMTAALWALRRRSQRAQAAVLVVGLDLASVLGLVYFGPLAGVGIMFFLGVLFAVLFFGARGGVAATAIIVVAMGAGAAAVHAGALTYGRDGPWDFGSPANWLRIGGTLVLGALSAIVLVGSMLHGLARALAALTESLRREESLREERERAVAALAEAQRLESLGRLAGGVAHEVNNALAIVLCSAEVIRTHTDPATVQLVASDIVHAAEGAARITRQLLAFGRGGGGRRVEIEPAVLVERLGRALDRLLPPSIRVEIDSTVSRSIVADDAQLDQALLNLALNARDAMPEGGVIRLAARDHGEHDVVLEVSDTGTGMDDATRARVFEPFFTTKDRGEGTGLGLALVHGIVTQHGGRVEVETAVGRGTTFRLHLPARTASNDDVPGEHAPDGVAPRAPRTPANAAHVLLAEDLPALRAVTRRWLVQAGFLVTDVPDAEAAIAACEAPGARFDVLLTDGIMPGARTVTELVDAFGARHGGPVVVCSGHVEENLVRHGIETGRYHLVRKPFEPARLIELLGDLLTTREPTRDRRDVVSRPVGAGSTSGEVVG